MQEHTKKQMLQKEQIQKRRQEIAEIRHADSVFRDITARENEREEYEKRWFWELLQNAKDSISQKERIKVKIEIDENQISFSHTGNPFELDDILSLIIQGSSKNNQEGKTGRFGTGFMTTYLLSKEVQIIGQLTENQGSFSFLLNRNAKDNKHFFLLQQESNNDFDDSIRSESYLGKSEFQTKFTYKLGEKGKTTAKVGLKSIDQLIPITQLFNEQIDSVEIVENGQSRTFTKTLLQSHESHSIKEWGISTLVNNEPSVCLKAYIFKNSNYESCIVTHFKDDSEKIYPLSNSYPKLYYTFPLIGTEEIGLPLVINSTNFDPRVERDGIYLKNDLNEETVLKNRQILAEAILSSSQSFAELFQEKKIKNIHKLFDYSISKDLKWIDQDWLTKTKIEVLEELASQPILVFNNSGNERTTLNDLTIPYSEDTKNHNQLWQILAEIHQLNVPLLSELPDWISICESISELKSDIQTPNELSFVWTIDNIIDLVEKQKTLTELNSVVTGDSIKWLNDFYALIHDIKGYFPLDKKISLNLNYEFRVAEGISWDYCKDDELIKISNLIGLNFSDHLFSREISEFQLNGVEKFILSEAMSGVKSKLNDSTGSNLNNSEFRECNAKFLKWLILNDNKETIKDLKVLTGESKKSEDPFIYDHFPKSDHLLLSPKAFFENEYPRFSVLIRDRDCLNECYNDILDEECFNYLSDNRFIHITPLVKRTDFATLKLLEHLIEDEKDLNLLRDEEGQLKHRFKITYTDFAYLTTSDGHIYARNTTQKSSLERLRFLLSEAVDKDSLFDQDSQEIRIEGIEKTIMIRQCLWVYRAKRLNWINIKVDANGSESKFVTETPSSKNLSEILKSDEILIKTIRGDRQQNLLNKLGVGVSDLIRNTLPNDELRLSWDKAITNMITSDADPELVQEIFNDPNIRNEYEKRLTEKRLISRNQAIGKLIEELFDEYIDTLKQQGISVNIDREPFGSDYILTDGSSDFVNDKKQREGFKIDDWLIELKATGKDRAAMTPLQAKTATENQNNYALVVVPLDGSEPDIDYLRNNARVISNIGIRINSVFTDFNEIEIRKNNISNGKDGISVAIEDQNIRFNIGASVWSTDYSDIKNFVMNNFSKK